ncbi:LamG domain-containing protein [Kitasatospora cathayae]|uniref:Beta-glucanase n=1 Tax=Kitasatospora cathayae TaxID=3004092 RepID=A0ABY7Q8V3_9ACTN|nr:beta-glucanase [Kitasatospora sp. HUAS 3-15]WBP89125.1 beta-glucanase [Kitasatospora sp. HUAS 3-15]
MAIRLLPALAMAVTTVLTSAAVPTAAVTAAARSNDTTVLLDRFTSLDLGPGRPWGWQSAAYAKCTENPDSWKLDRLTRDALSTADGHLTVTAQHRADGKWETGLLTTGDSCDSGGSGFQLRTGDLVVVHVRMPAAGTGAWPCLWTWRDGGNELDLFEWYADHPDRIEFVNHVRSSSTLYSGPDIGPGQWVYVAVRLGADDDTWYVGPSRDRLTPVWSDGTGVGPGFSAYLVLSLSIGDGTFHLPPSGTDPVSMEVDLLSVERPGP